MEDKRLIVEMDVDQDKMQKFFDVIEFLETNADTLTKDLCPVVRNYLSREDIFKGPFKAEYNNEFSTFILGLLKASVMDNLNLNYEEASILMDEELLEMTGVLEYFLNKDAYKETQ